MTGALAIFLCLFGAYLIGSIPFGLLIARWFGGIDIREAGSGNIGATNVGRVLGFRFFVAVFLLDYLKGFLPTHYFPGLVALASPRVYPGLAVGMAVATIFGHNFPAYLKFRGGKGVATSLGAVSALDAFASVAAATGFAVVLLITRFVSMSSILGGLVWIFAHFSRVEHPLAREEIALTLASFGLMGLLVARHRKNLVRIWRGTEPRVNLRKKKPRRDGRVAALLVVGLVATAAGGGVAYRASRPSEAAFGPYRAREVCRVATGHQRAERLAFADDGRLLVATCPRYNRAMFYRVTEDRTLELARDVTLGGRPVAVAPAGGLVLVLVRPTNDARHVQEGWWEAFDLEGRAAGPRIGVGFYPDDLAVTPDGRHALVLASGRGEGGDHRPAPGIVVHDLAGSSEVARLAFDGPGDDPARLALSPDGKTAAVSLRGSHAVAWVDLSDLSQPRLIARTTWPGDATPDAVRFDHRGGLLATDESGEAVRHQAGPGAPSVPRGVEGGVGDVVEVPGPADFWVVTAPFDSGLAFLPAGPGGEAGEVRLPIKGRGNLADTRPLGLAFEPRRGLLAVSNRSGGSIHLVALRRGPPPR